jgi:hypothetical protein
VELVDQLLAILAGPNPGFASQQLRAAGYGEDEISGAWNFARAAGFTESSGLGQDRLTPAGRARAATIRSAD